MPSFIVHRKGAYNIFSTVSDMFYFEPAATLSELEEWYQAEYGNPGMKTLTERLERAHATGCSAYQPFDGIDWIIDSNRCGEMETTLSESECIARFLTL